MNVNKIITILVMILLLMPLAQALGVTPGRTTLHFEPNLEKEVKFTVLNNEHKDVKLAIYARGTLAEFIEISDEKVELKPDEDSEELSYKIELPEEMEEPGLHEAEIVIREVTIGGEEGEITIGAMQAVITQLHVYVPYPGKYIVITRVDIVKRKTSNDILFFVPLVNFGDEDVKSAKAEITVMDPYENIIDKVETDEKQVPAKGRAELKASMDLSKLTAGIYEVIVEVTYDGLTTVAKNAFYTDDFLLIPLDISVRDFTLGDIAKFNILVENIGNKEIIDAFSLMLLDSKDKQVANLKSVPIDFKPSEKKEMVNYWDTKGVKADEYTGKLILKYEDRSDEKVIRALVTKNAIKAVIIGVTGYAIREEGAPEGTSPLLYVIVILVIMNIGWFAFYFFSKRKRGGHSKENEGYPGYGESEGYFREGKNER